MSTLQMSEDRWPLLRFFLFDKYSQFFQPSFVKKKKKPFQVLSHTSKYWFSTLYVPDTVLGACNEQHVPL